jgi:hypothetical protein
VPTASTPSGSVNDRVNVLDLYVLLGQTGRIGPEDELALVLDQIHRRYPPAQRCSAAVAGGR